MGNTTFSDQVQDMWRTRPFRLPQLGKVAGVSAGIAQRYQVDPVLVRVAFVVSTIFGGSGIVLYLAGWLLFRKPSDQVSPAESLLGRGASSDSTTKAIVLVVAFAIAFSTFTPVGVGLGGSGIISLVLMLGGWWLLYQRQPVAPPLPAGLVTYPAQPGAAGFPGAYLPPTPAGMWGHQAWRHQGWGGSHFGPAQWSHREQQAPVADTGVSFTTAPAQEPSAQEPSAEGQPTVSLAKESATTNSPTASAPRPPAWDPLGVAPFAWDLPEPAPAARPVVAVPRSRVAPVTLGLTLIVTAAVAAIATALDSDWLSPARIGSVALAVVGLGLIIGARRGAGYGLLVVAAPLAGFVVLASLAGPLHFEHGAGERNYAPGSLTELQDEYRLGAGSLNLDLRNVDLTEDRTVRAAVGFGEVIVTLPEDMSVRNDCQVTFGETNCLTGGALTGTDPDSPVLTLDLAATTGTVEVRRG